MHETDWKTEWIALEEAGESVGIDFAVNPVLYPEIITAVQEPVALYDLGCGTASLGIDLLLRDKEAVPGLQCVRVDQLQDFRSNIHTYIGYEKEEAFVEYAKNQIQVYGAEHMQSIMHDATQIPAEVSGENAIAVSRNMLMHLSNQELELHLQQVSTFVRKGFYIFSILNPEYEQHKYDGHLEEGEQYAFSFGEKGEYGTIPQYYRSRNFFESQLEEYFTIKKVIDCQPITQRFTHTHARYYGEVPMALVYGCSVK